jgi:CHASE2 domain-containing sensor protein
MSASCQLSQSRLGLLCSATLVLGADLILICWRLADGQLVWIPALGACAMLCTSFSVLLEATKREGVI